MWRTLPDPERERHSRWNSGDFPHPHFLKTSGQVAMIYTDFYRHLAASWHLTAELVVGLVVDGDSEVGDGWFVTQNAKSRGPCSYFTRNSYGS
jgi:hypothetical protein